MINLWLRGCSRVRPSAVTSIVWKSSPSSFDTRRCFGSDENNKQLTQFTKSKEIRGYFVEDFNVKGQAFWDLTSKASSFAILYTGSSVLTAFGVYFVMSSSYAIDIIVMNNFMDFLTYFNLPEDANISRLLTLVAYFFTEPFRLLFAYRFRERLRDVLFAKGLLKQAKYKRFKGDKDYQDEKIGRF